MAKDPLLNIELENAEAREIDTRTGREGGLIPAGANPESRASRTWYVDRADGREQLLAAVRAAADLDTALRRLRCSEGSLGSDFVYQGRKGVSVGEEVVSAGVRIALNIDPPEETEPSRSRLTIRLSSEGTPEAPERPERDTASISGDCPSALVDTFEEVQARP